MVEFVIIAALSNNNIIADESGIPWDLPNDLEHYKSTVTDEVVISGRKTFEASGEIAKKSIVLSNNENWNSNSDTVKHATSIEQAKKIAEEVSHNGVVYIVGGESVYNSFIDIADKMILSHVHRTVEGNTYFPKFDENNWNVFRKQPYDEFTIKYYKRR
jgi:dihydrofolate reductase